MQTDNKKQRTFLILLERFNLSETEAKSLTERDYEQAEQFFSLPADIARLIYENEYLPDIEEDRHQQFAHYLHN